MKMVARTLISLVMTAGLGAVAHAQAKQPTAPAPAAKTAPAVTGGAPAPVKPATPPVAPKADRMPAAEPAKPAKPVAPPAPPAPPAEVAAMAKTAGNWRCTGVAMGPAGEMKMTATVKNKLDLDKWWVHTSLAETGGGKFKFEAYTTFDGKKWHRVMVDNMGSQEVSTSDGVKDGKIQWDSTSRSSMGSMPGRHFEDSTNPKELKMWGEYSMDKGKTYLKAYDVTCKR